MLSGKRKKIKGKKEKSCNKSYCGRKEYQWHTWRSEGCCIAKRLQPVLYRAARGRQQENITRWLLSSGNTMKSWDLEMGCKSLTQSKSPGARGSSVYAVSHNHACSAAWLSPNLGHSMLLDDKNTAEGLLEATWPSPEGLGTGLPMGLPIPAWLLQNRNQPVFNLLWKDGGRWGFLDPWEGYLPRDGKKNQKK